MKQVHPGLLLLAGVGLVVVGNALASQGGFLDIAGTGIGLFGDLLIIYALYLGVRWAFGKKAVEKKPAPPTPPKQS